MATEGTQPGFTVGTVEIDDLLAHAGWMRELAWRMVRDHGAADDIVQDTWVAALAHPPQGGRPVRPWLRTLLANMAHKRRRGETRRRDRETLAEAREATPATDDLLAQIELQRELISEVVRLHEPYRSVILRRFYRGESAAHIARQTGIPAATIRSQIDRGLDQLREHMLSRRNAEGGDPRELHSNLYGALLALAGDRTGPLVGTLTSGLTAGFRAALTMKNSTSVVGALGILLVLVLVGVAAWGALKSGPTDTDQASPLDLPLKAAEQTTEGAELASGNAAPTTIERTAVKAAPPTETAPSSATPPIESPTTLTARVINEASIPLAGATLGQREIAKLSEPSTSDGQVTLELRDDDLLRSAYRKSDLPRVFAASCPDHATLFVRATPTLGESTDLGDLVLAPGGAVSGRVVDRLGEPQAGLLLVATHSRIEGSTVSARRLGPERDVHRDLNAPTARSGADGTFTLHGLSVGSTRVWCQGSDDGWSFTDALEVEAGSEIRDVVVVVSPLESADRIAGVVQDEEGRPVPKARIEFQFPSSYSATRVLLADDQGAFEIVLEAREPHAIRALDPTGKLTPAVARGVAPGTQDLEFVLTTSSWIAIHARDREGIALIEGLKAHTRSKLPLSRSKSQSMPHSVGLRVRVPHEPFDVVVRMPGYLQAKQGPFDPLGPPASLDFELEALGGIAGRVVFDGAPVPEAAVQLRPLVHPRSEISTKGFRLRIDAYPEVEARTDEAGQFEFATESPGPYVILVRASGYATAEWGPMQIDPLIPVRDLEIEMLRGGSIEGHLLPTAGREPVGLLISISRGDGDVQVERTDEEGHYRFDDLTPGGWNVAQHLHQGQESVRYQPSLNKNWEPRWDCHVQDGLVTRHDIDLRSEFLAKVSGSLTLDGHAAAGWTARAVHRYAEELTDPVRPVAVGADGTFELRVVPGTYELSLQSPASLHGHVRLARKLEIGTDGLEWGLSLETGALKGTSALGSGRLLYTSSLQTDDGTRSGTSSTATLIPDGDGLFSLDGIPVGSGTLHRFEPKPSIGRDVPVKLRELDLEPGETLELDV